MIDKTIILSLDPSRDQHARAGRHKCNGDTERVGDHVGGEGDADVAGDGGGDDVDVGHFDRVDNVTDRFGIMGSQDGEEDGAEDGECKDADDDGKVDGDDDTDDDGDAVGENDDRQHGVTVRDNPCSL